MQPSTRGKLLAVLLIAAGTAGTSSQGLAGGFRGGPGLGQDPGRQARSLPVPQDCFPADEVESGARNSRSVLGAAVAGAAAGVAVDRALGLASEAGLPRYGRTLVALPLLYAYDELVYSLIDDSTIDYPWLVALHGNDYGLALPFTSRVRSLAWLERSGVKQPHSTLFPSLFPGRTELETADFTAER